MFIRQSGDSSQCVLTLLIVVSGGESRYGCTFALDLPFS
jgi:hypothetical protein